MSHRPLVRISPPLLAASALLLLLVLGSQLAGQSAAPLTVLAPNNRRTLPVALVGTQEMVALDDLASTFQLAVHEEGGAITVSSRGRTIILTPEQALASIAGRLISLPVPPTRVNGRWLVPVEFINRALVLVHEGRLELRRPSRLLLVGDVRVPRVTIRPEIMTSAARVTIDATPRAASSVVQENNRLLVRFEADLVDATIPPIQPQGATGLLDAVQLLDPVTVAIDLGPRFGGFRSSTQTLDDTARLVIDIVATAVETAAPSTPPPVAPPSDLPPLGVSVPTLRTIAIDPGHGGDDEGAKSADGVLEKDLTLGVARRLKGAIEARLGIRVLLTRDDDRAVPLDERTSMANNNKADLFISLHANAAVHPARTGASIYVASFPDGAATLPPSAERIAVFGGGSRDIELVPWDLAQIRFVDRSTTLATLLEAQFTDRVPLDTRAVGRAPFRVLESANMPAVLLEMGYLTNQEQARQLAGAEFQTAFVQAVFEAVVKFRDLAPGEGGER